MIKGVHTMFYSSKAEELRGFIRDKLGFRSTDVGEGWLICVCEDHGADGEAVNKLVRVDLAGGAPQDLVTGFDFYACPRLSPDGRQLAWLCWNHPHMPWDGCELWLASVSATVRSSKPPEPRRSTTKLSAPSALSVHESSTRSAKTLAVIPVGARSAAQAPPP